MTNFVKLSKEKISSNLYMENLERLSRKDLLQLINQQKERIDNLEGLLTHKSTEQPLKCRWHTLPDARLSQFKKYIKDNKVHFVTQTYDQKHYLPKHLEDQVKYMEYAIDETQHHHNIKYILYVLEHHSSGVVHSHILLVDDDSNNLMEYEYSLRLLFTNKPRYLNRNNQQVDKVHESEEDYDRILKYMSKSPILIKEYYYDENKAYKAYQKQREEQIEESRQERIRKISQLLDA